MEESFRVRVDKIFGSLEPSPSSSSSSLPLNSLWSLTDDEIERKEWNRDKGIPADELESKPYPSNLDGFFANRQQMASASSSCNKPQFDDFRQQLVSDLQDLGGGDDDSGDDDEFEQEKKQPLESSSSRQLDKPDDHSNEEWDIRSSVGLDTTLDKEEEEDVFDKVAIGREESADYVYMSDITDYEVYIDSKNELPSTFKDVTRDPRANHMAAKIRLKEDDEAAGNFDYSQISSIALPSSVHTQNNSLEGLIDLKSILKRKESQMATESEKRVRFEPGCEGGHEEDVESTKAVAMEESPASGEVSFQPLDSSGVPDYVRNALNYMHYTFDSSGDSDEETNQTACMDFLNSFKGSKTMETEDGVSIDIPKSIIFTPKKKSGDSLMKNESNSNKDQEDEFKEYMQKKGTPLGIAAGNAQDCDVCAMEEDEPEMVTDTSSIWQKAGRRYRSKGSTNLDEYVR